MDMYVNVEKLVVLPTIPLGRADKNGHIPYLNREIARIVCKAGFDGWVVCPFNPAKKRGLVQYSMIHGVVQYSPEIMLCKWSQFMDAAAAPPAPPPSQSKRGTAKKSKSSKS